MAIAACQVGKGCGMRLNTNSGAIVVFATGRRWVSERPASAEGLVEQVDGAPDYACKTEQYAHAYAVPDTVRIACRFGDRRRPCNSATLH